MIRLVSFVLILGTLVACNSNRVVTPTGPTPQPPTGGALNGANTLNGVLRVGEDLRGTFNGPWMFYELTSPGTGTLVVRLSWDPATGAKLTIEVANVNFAGSFPNWSPVLGRVPVTAGQRYLLKIDQVSPWDYDFSVAPFVLSTAFELSQR